MELHRKKAKEQERKHVCVSEKETQRGCIEKSIWDIWSGYGFKNRVFDTSLSCTFNVQIKESINFIRLNHYPPCSIPHLALGVGRHKDSGALTFLAQDDVGGLEVNRKTDGEWVRVQPTPDAYIINVGDIVQVWSNDTYESVEHRPLEELTKGEKPKYRAYNWGKFFVTRRRNNFKKLDVENLQISHFKVSE
ncbi:Feruloyl CoA ortho-hydroxylase 2 [Vitis vinifera]|uniref:Feruloyl CoA ortho-hydroxylase 2 n=1 Tax=Vitis vinifera TaxID=29760 RepID=A0A438FMS2_VITVI|nr:Feruloyl CoA ortho-hydroxylase 2 [Vitis vinifera]